MQIKAAAGTPPKIVPGGRVRFAQLTNIMQSDSSGKGSTALK